MQRQLKTIYICTQSCNK